VKILFTAIGVVVATLVLTSHWFARDTHGDHRTRAIAAVVIVAVWFLAGHLAARGRKPKPPAAPTRPVSPFSGTRR
jgi:cytochrome bd-type quinol oxidase subunit 2